MLTFQKQQKPFIWSESSKGTLLFKRATAWRPWAIGRQGKNKFNGLHHMGLKKSTCYCPQHSKDITETKCWSGDWQNTLGPPGVSLSTHTRTHARTHTHTHTHRHLTKSGSSIKRNLVPFKRRTSRRSMTWTKLDIHQHKKNADVIVFVTKVSETCRFSCLVLC